MAPSAKSKKAAKSTSASNRKKPTTVTSSTPTTAAATTQSAASTSAASLLSKAESSPDFTKAIATTSQSQSQSKPTPTPSPSKKNSKTVDLVSASSSSTPLNSDQVLKASSALLKFLSTQSHAPSSKPQEGQKINLLDEDNTGSTGIFGGEQIWLVVTTKKFLSDKRQLKPIRVVLPHPLLNPTTTTALLLVKDPQRTYKDLLLPSSPTVQKVVGLSKLRSKHKTYESLRQLRDTHDLILADDRILPSLRTVLGSTFLRSTTKVPIPVDIANTKSPERIHKEIRKAVQATYIHLAQANSVNIRVGLAKHNPEQLVDNIVKVVDAAITNKKVVKGGWKGVRAIYIKSGSSAALPVYLSSQLHEGEKDVTSKEEREEEKKKAEEKRKARKEKKREKREKERLRGEKARKRKAEDEAQEGGAEAEKVDGETPSKKRLKVKEREGSGTGESNGIEATQEPTKDKREKKKNKKDTEQQTADEGLKLDSKKKNKEAKEEAKTATTTTNGTGETKTNTKAKSKAKSKSKGNKQDNAPSGVEDEDTESKAQETGVQQKEKQKKTPLPPLPPVEKAKGKKGKGKGKGKV